MKILAVIPARGGSKGFPGKNVAPLKGSPLISWTIRASLGSPVVTRTVVSSDDEKILEIALKEGAGIINRPAELAEDSTPTVPVVNHVLECVGLDWDWLMVLQPTSPLRTSVHISRCAELAVSSCATSVISVCHIDNRVMKSFQIMESGFLKTLIQDDTPFTPRQALPPIVLPNGAMYLTQVQAFRKFGGFFTDRTLPFFMSSSESIDIDSIDDIARVEGLML